MPVNKTVETQEFEMIEKVIKIDRVNKVVKGGKRLAFRAFVISGNKNGKVGFGLGKSKEVPVAIKKGIERSQKKLNEIKIINGTIPHEVIGRFSTSRVILKPAKAGTGVIAGGPIRILLETAGLKNIVAKALGSRNSINVTKAALNGLLSLRNREEEEKERGKKLSVYVEQLDEKHEELMKKLNEQERIRKEEERVNKEKEDAKRMKNKRRGGRRNNESFEKTPKNKEENTQIVVEAKEEKIATPQVAEKSEVSKIESEVKKDTIPEDNSEGNSEKKG